MFFQQQPTTARAKLLTSNPLRFETLEPRHVLDAGPLLISKLLAVNDSVHPDGNDDLLEWIEIHNPTETQVQLGPPPQ